MTSARPRVQDLTTAPRQLGVEVVAGEVFELLLALFVLGTGGTDEEYEVGDAWFEEIRSRIPADLSAQIEALGDCGEVWAPLVGEAHAMGAPYTVDRFLKHLRGADPIDLRRGILSVGWKHDREPIDEAAIDRVAAGEPGGLVDLPEWCTTCSGLVSLMEMTPAGTRDTLVGVLHDFWESAQPVGPDTVRILERDADHKRAMARRMAPERLVETATNGITVAAQPDLAGVILIPSVVTRPWVIVTEREGYRIFCYSVADEHLSADPDAPPSWLVQFYKALGDERRLQILGRLAEGPASLGDLVGLLGLVKSTVHHHLRQLRTAGLVRVTVGDEKEYSLRTDAVPEAARLLEGFLGLGATAV